MLDGLPPLNHLVLMHHEKFHILGRQQDKVAVVGAHLLFRDSLVPGHQV